MFFSEFFFFSFFCLWIFLFFSLSLFDQKGEKRFFPKICSDKVLEWVIWKRKKECNNFWPVKNFFFRRRKTVDYLLNPVCQEFSTVTVNLLSCFWGLRIEGINKTLLSSRNISLSTNPKFVTYTPRNVLLEHTQKL